MGEHGPRAAYKSEGVLGESETVVFWVQYGRELLELAPNELEVIGVGAADLEDREVVQMAIAEAFSGGEQDVGHG